MWGVGGLVLVAARMYGAAIREGRRRLLAAGGHLIAEEDNNRENF